MQHQQELMQRMSSMSLSQQQQQQQQPQVHRANSTGSTGSAAGRSEGRASARIARSHRAGGAYNPAEVRRGRCLPACLLRLIWGLAAPVAARAALLPHIQTRVLTAAHLLLPCPGFPALPAPCVQFAFDLEEAESGRAEARCTVMIRNCPNKYSQEMMLSILEKSGFR